MDPRETLGQGGEFGPAAIGLPNHATIVEQTNDYALRRAAQGLDAVARLKRSAFAKALDDFHHALPVQHAGNVVGNGGGNYPAATGRQVSKESGSDLPGDVCKRIAVEEKERGAPMAVPEEI